MKFFTELPETSNPPLFSDWATYLYPNSAALHLDAIPTDTAVWYSVSGTYIPDSAYRYLVVGNFFEDSLSDPILIDTIGYGNLNAAYAFIDDVRASSDLTFCDSSTGVGIREIFLPKVYPNPFTAELLVEVPTRSNGPWSIHLFNTIGALVMSQLDHNGPVIRLLTGNLPVGVYHLHITSFTGASHSAVLIHTN
jgi:Secretion system C-terminal sorting domain